MDELRHECGIAAVYDFDPKQKSAVWPGDPEQVHRLIPRMLLDLQNRGQLSAGLTPYNPTRDQLLDTYKEIGTVSEAFRMSQAEQVRVDPGRARRARRRSATSATPPAAPTGRSYAQPFERRHGCKWKWFGFAFNGNLANFQELRAELLSLSDYHLTRDNDTEVIMHFLAHELRGDERPDLVEVFRRLSKKFDGAYNLSFLNAMGEHDRPARPARACGRCATRPTAACSRRPARAWRCRTSASGTSSRCRRGT